MLGDKRTILMMDTVSREQLGGCRKFDCMHYPVLDDILEFNEGCKLCHHYKPFNFYIILKTKEDKE